jgi:dTDP-4-dehydrorhamnose reductase
MNRPVLLLGYTGQLGWECHRSLASLGELVALDYPEIDFGRPESLRSIISDRAEGEPEIVRQINAVAPGVLAQEALKCKATFIHISTDYVFDGTKNTPYTEDDLPNPLGVYAQSKLEGERLVQDVGGSYLILRTSWLYSLRKDGFVTRILKLAHEQKTIRAVTDQVGNPTSARMLAEIIAQLLAISTRQDPGWLAKNCGIYHLGGDGYTSRFEWARSILRGDSNSDKQQPVELLPAITADFPAPAERPLFTAMDCSLFTRSFGLRLPPWELALTLELSGKRV